MKSRSVQMLLSSAALTLATTLGAAASHASPTDDPEFHKVEFPQVLVNPNDYPRMTDKEIGHIRHIARLARNPYGDWSGFGSAFTPLQREQMFVIPFMALAMELAQHELTPAYHEIYQSSIENLLKKLQHPDIWERWAFESRNGSVGEHHDEPLNWMTNPGWIDPILKDNIQLKAYILQVAATYQMLYGDQRYEQPGAFTFKWKGGMSNGQMTFRYTLTDMVKNTYQEVEDSGYVGSACEPGHVFWVCNGPSNAGFIVYDHLYGTHYGDAGPKMNAKWIKDGYRDPKTYRTVYFVSTSLRDPSKDVEAATPLTKLYGGEQGGWGALYNVAWDYDYTHAQYMAHRDEELDEFLTRKKFKQELAEGASQAVPASTEVTVPDEELLGDTVEGAFFMAYAGEMGDREARDKMLAYADRNLHPVWENGEYYYPRNDDYSVDAHGNVHGVDVWAGSVLIPMARLNRGQGLRKLYTETLDPERYKQPFISDVDTLTAGVSQAFFDPKKNALIVTLLPGPIATKDTSFVVRQLDPTKSYQVIKDGKPVGELSAKRQPASTTWRDDGTVLISTSITAAHTFVLVGK